MAEKSNEFLGKYKIEIPIIQRDYVQGADRWKSKRDAFVERLLTALNDNDPVVLDFIYGSKSNDVTGFTPLDGQQRLTTLNLLGWVLIQHELSSEDITDEYRAKLFDWRKILGLKYETRASSTEFCDHLFGTDVPFYPMLSTAVKNCIWYAERWDYDPTIVAMLQMIDAISTKLSTLANSFDISKMTERFFTDSPIRFEVQNISKNTGIDDLYIKINARGKQLTDFEHFKVKFISLLAEKHPNSEYNGLSYKDYFEQRIENEWCNLLWDYAIADYNDKTDKYPRIDEYFMRLFNTFTDYIWQSQTQSDCKDTEIGQVISVYENPIAVELLFRVLDSMVIIANAKQGQSPKDAIDSFFNSLLYTTLEPKDDRIKTEARVNIFAENNEHINLFKTLISEGNVNIRRVLLFLGIVEYVAHYGTNHDQLQEFVRVWWAFIMLTKRQRLAKGYAVGANINLKDDAKEFRNALDHLLKNRDVHQCPGLTAVDHVINKDFYKVPGRYEADVLPLLNHPWLLYDIHILRDVLADSQINSGDVYVSFISNFVDQDNSYRVKKMIEGGYHGTKVNNKSITYGIISNWSYIFTDDNASTAAAICNVIRNAPAQPISGANQELTQFVHDYCDKLNAHANQFAAFIIDSPYQVFSVEKSRGFSKKGYRTEPYAFMVAKLAGADEFSFYQPNCKIKAASGQELRLTIHCTDSVHYGLCITDYHLELECQSAGCFMHQYESEEELRPLPAAFTARFGTDMANLTDSENAFTVLQNVFAMPNEDDPVKVAVSLLKAVLDTL